MDTEPLQHHFMIVATRQADGTITYAIDPECGYLDDGDLWDPNIGDWRFPENDAEIAEAGAIVGDLQRRLA